MTPPRKVMPPAAEVLLSWGLPVTVVAAACNANRQTVARWRADCGYGTHVPGSDPATVPDSVLADVLAGKYRKGDALPSGLLAAPRAAGDEQTAAERVTSLREQERAAAERKAERLELKRLASAVVAREAYQQTIADYAPLLSVPVLERAPALRDPPKHTWVQLLSDWHVGQKTTSEHTGGLFEQSLELTKGQVRDLWRTLELLHSIARKSIHVEEVRFLALGDNQEGSAMRPRQAVEIDGLATKQAVEVADLLAWLLQHALSLFPKVSIDLVGGNHDRVSEKPGLAGLGELGYHDTYAWLVGEFLRRMFSKAIEAGRLELTNWESFFGVSLIAGQRFVFEHGASFRTSSGSYGGIGFYPIANAAGRYQQMLDGAEFVCFGHFHQAACLPMGRGWQVLNGALPPSSPYVQSSFKRVGTPSQVLLDLHPKHGLVGFRPIYLPHPAMAAPGEAWRRLAAAEGVALAGAAS